MIRFRSQHLFALALLLSRSMAEKDLPKNSDVDKMGSDVNKTHARKLAHITRSAIREYKLFDEPVELLPHEVAVSVYNRKGQPPNAHMCHVIIWGSMKKMDTIPVSLQASSSGTRWIILSG